jgi:hypothetical protein
VEDRRRGTRFDRTGTDAFGSFRDDARGRHGQSLTRFVLIPKWYGEPSLDTPNLRPVLASSQGPKLTHVNPQMLLAHLIPRKIRPTGTRHPL